MQLYCIISYIIYGAFPHTTHTDPCHAGRDVQLHWRGQITQLGATLFKSFTQTPLHYLHLGQMLFHACPLCELFWVYGNSAAITAEGAQWKLGNIHSLHFIENVKMVLILLLCHNWKLAELLDCCQCRDNEKRLGHSFTFNLPFNLPDKVKKQTCVNTTQWFGSDSDP